MTTFQLQALMIGIMLLMAISLLNGFYVLFKDDGDPGSKRTFYSLSVRVTLAAALLITMIYGFCTGKLESQAPWNNPAINQQQPVQK